MSKTYAPNLKIALINAIQSKLTAPFPLVSIGTYLLYKNIIRRKNLVILDINLRDPIDFFHEFKPDLVGISALTESYPEAGKLAKRIKKILKIPIIVGNYHITAFPEQLAKYPFDIGVIGEGEEIFLELVKSFSMQKRFVDKELMKIKGIIFKSNSVLKKTAPRPLIQPLDLIPLPDWSLLPPKIYFRYFPVRKNGKWKAMRTGTIYTSRGCPYSCNFCSIKAMWKNIRFFSPKHVADQIETLAKKYKIEAVQIYEDTFTLSKTRLSELIRLLKKRKLLNKFVVRLVFARSDLIDQEFISFLKKLRIDAIFYGFESGSDRIVRRLKNNTVTLKDNLRAAQLTDEAGIGIIASMIVGSPNETKSDLNKTIDFMNWLAKKNSLRDFVVHRCTPLPGSPLWQYALKKGVVSNDMNWRDLNFKKKNRYKIFFHEKLSPIDRKETLNEVRKIRQKFNVTFHKQKGYLEALNATNRKNHWLDKISGLMILWQEVKSGRSEVAIKRAERKAISRLKIILPFLKN